MRRRFYATVSALSLGAFMLNATLSGGTEQAENTILFTVSKYQYDLENEGRGFLLNEANDNDFFLLGELHGENEIPALLRVLWPEMWACGYRHIAAEVSPWAAHQLEFVPEGKGPKIRGLWTKREATEVHAAGDSKTSVLWGCDMEEEQPEFLIRELAGLNPDDASLEQMTELTKGGYDRKLAPTLLNLAKQSSGKKDETFNDLSVRENLLSTLEIETHRLKSDTRMIAQEERERLMKVQFLEHFRRAKPRNPSKALFRFGRNHLHRGYDARGISTLGNFIAEFAIAEDKKAFNVGAFGAGGTASLLGNSWSADERQDELAFALLAERARYSATVFDLRPVRALLHQIPREKRSALESNLVYWADSYDALICYKTVTPLKP